MVRGQLDDPIIDIADVSAMFTAVDRKVAESAVGSLVSDFKKYMRLDPHEDGYILFDENYNGKKMPEN